MVSGALFVAVVAYATAVIGLAVVPAITDARADWLVVTAAADGGDPWSDLLELSQLYGLEMASIGGAELGDIERVHPRTPGSLLLLMPLTLVSGPQVYPVMLVVSALLAAVTGLFVFPAFGWASRANTLLAAAVMAASTAFLSSLEYGTESVVLLSLLAVGWLLLRQRDSWTGGVAIGVAITLKLFPGLLLIPLWVWGRRRGVVGAIGTAVAFNLLGLWVFELNPLAALQALTLAGSQWMGFSGNGSVAMALVRAGITPLLAGTTVVVVALVLATVVSARRGSEAAFALAVPLALLSSPLSWEHYDLLLIPVAAFAIWVARQRGRIIGPAVVLVGIWTLLQMVAGHLGALLGVPEYGLGGILSLAGRLVVLAAAYLAWRAPEEPQGTGRFREVDASRG